jgi:hypothetical protein
VGTPVQKRRLYAAAKAKKLKAAVGKRGEVNQPSSNPKARELDRLGRPKAPGNAPGTNHRRGVQNRKTIEAEQALQNAYRLAFGRLNQEELDALKPSELYRIMMTAALSVGRFQEALAAARELSPFVEPKLGLKDPNPPDEVYRGATQIIEIIGGTPKKRQFELERDLQA